jgi:phospho-N-acetylmuramoyl-pentapeptide-transferase
MLYYISQYLLEETAGTQWGEWVSPLRLFGYITFRSVGAAITALLLSWLMGPPLIAWLKRLRFGQDYEDKAAEAGGLTARVLSKRGVPTMGGVLIVSVLDLVGLLWCQWNSLVVLTLLSVVVLAGLGFYDDFMKITRQNNRGTTSLVKLVVQTALALVIGWYLWSVPATETLVSDIMVPFYKYPVMTGAGGVEAET